MMNMVKNVAQTKVPNGTAGTMKDMQAELATAAYRAAERDGFCGAFIDAELDMWYAFRALNGKAPAVAR